MEAEIPTMRSEGNLVCHLAEKENLGLAVRL